MDNNITVMKSIIIIVISNSFQCSRLGKEGLKQFVPIIDYKICKWLHKISKICLQASIIDVVPQDIHIWI